MPQQMHGSSYDKVDFCSLSSPSEQTYEKFMTNACTCTFTENYKTIVKLIGIKEKNMNIKMISQYL